MIKYVFKEPIVALKGVKDANPQKIGEALAKIAADNGGDLTPIAVVDAARAPKHVLHRHFEWDDKAAAESWRLDQARHIIRVIRCEDEETDQPIPAFVSISDSARGSTSYRTIQDVRASPDLQRLILAQAERDLMAFEKRYNELEDICALVRRAREALARRRSQRESRADA